MRGHLAALPIGWSGVTDLSKAEPKKVTKRLMSVEDSKKAQSTSIGGIGSMLTIGATYRQKVLKLSNRKKKPSGVKLGVSTTEQFSTKEELHMHHSRIESEPEGRNKLELRTPKR